VAEDVGVGSEADEARRTFLARVEAALRAAGVGDLECAYRPIAPAFRSGAPLVTGLVITHAGVASQARVVVAAREQQVVPTRLLAGQPALEALGARLQALGIGQMIGQMVVGVGRRSDDFPGGGAPTYELTILAPDAAEEDGQVRVAADGAAWRLLDWHTTADVAAVARRIKAWRDAVVDGYPPRPRDAASLAPLRAAAQARRALLAAVEWEQVEALRRAGRLGEAWRLAGLATEVDPEQARQPGVALTAAAQERLRADLAALLPLHLQWHAPRDERGRLALDEEVLLAAYESATPLGQGRQIWLAAVSPARRREPQVLTLRLADLIGENHTHVWSAARWRWDARAQGVPRAQRWGVDGLPLERLGLDGWRSLPSEGPAERAGELEEGERAARCVALQDAGRLREALGLYDVELDAGVERLLEGRPLPSVGLQETEAWARAVQEGLRLAAPWRFGPLLGEAARARERWVAEKRARKWSAPMLRLFWLPHQPEQRKGAVMLRARERNGRRPRLELEWSASNARLPAVAWQRPLELDLLRFGLLAEEELP